MVSTFYTTFVMKMKCADSYHQINFQKQQANNSFSLKIGIV